MKKQKICIIGGSLTALVTAITLSKMNCEIDLIIGNSQENQKSNRTTAISHDNFNFLKKLNISKLPNKYVWACSIMKLYTETENKNFSKVLELSNENKKEKVLYMMQNSKITKLMMQKIRKTKSISITKHEKISEVKDLGLLKSIKLNNKDHKYNLIIMCTGSNSELVKNNFVDTKIENSYKEESITTILKHKSKKNNIVRQIFLDNEIIAMLPISNTMTSIVWCKKRDKKKNNYFYKRKIKLYTASYLKNISFSSDLEFRKLNFLIRKKYYKDRILLFGDALHVMHPFVGQGFNMILRDLGSLEKVLNENLALGLDVGSSDILSEFSKKTKPANFAFSVSTDILKHSFSLKNVYFKEARNEFFKILNKNNFAKNIFFNMANKGFRF